MLKLIDERNKILKCEDPESKFNLDLLNKRISCLEAEDNRNKLIQNIFSILVTILKTLTCQTCGNY